MIEKASMKAALRNSDSNNLNHNAVQRKEITGTLISTLLHKQIKAILCIA